MTNQRPFPRRILRVNRAHRRVMRGDWPMSRFFYSSMLLAAIAASFVVTPAGSCAGGFGVKPGAAAPPGGGGSGSDWIFRGGGIDRLGGPGGCKVGGGAS